MTTKHFTISLVQSNEATASDLAFAAGVNWASLHETSTDKERCAAADADVNRDAEAFLDGVCHGNTIRKDLTFKNTRYTPNMSNKEHMKIDDMFTWKSRIVASVERKASALWMSGDEVGAAKLRKSITKLSKWVEKYIDDDMEAKLDNDAEVNDPYGYRGLTRSMFF
jgi:hypothetical protein